MLNRANLGVGVLHPLSWKAELVESVRSVAPACLRSGHGNPVEAKAHGDLHHRQRVGAGLTFSHVTEPSASTGLAVQLCTRLQD